jgi:DNA-binding NarL/FixJ family response regulator
MVRDAVLTALRSEGLVVGSIAAPLDPAELREALRALGSGSLVVGAYLTELDKPEQLCEAAGVVRHRDVTWLVLTTTEPGPCWGAIVEAGAHLVLPKHAPLQRVLQEIRTAGHGGPFADRRFEEAMTAWHRAPPERRAQLRRLEALSPGEMTTLLDLDSGSTTDQIAEHSRTSTGTVRARLSSISRKLQVSSRAEAVLAYREVSRWLAS